ncbi:hypothetical protein EBS80_00420 [bacterium]|nr:hypothetical protein [bacterium]
MRTLTLADDVLPHTFDGIDPATKFERDVLAGPVLASFNAVTLGHDVFRLFRWASFLHGDETRPADPTVADRHPPSQIWGLSIEKIAAYLARVLGPEFKTTTMCLNWSTAMNKTRSGAKRGETTDVAANLRGTVSGAVRSFRESPVARAAAYANFQMALTVLAPILAGEVTRADLSA